MNTRIYLVSGTYGTTGKGVFHVPVEARNKKTAVKKAVSKMRRLGYKNVKPEYIHTAKKEPS